MTVEHLKDEIIIRIPANTDIEDVKWIIDFINSGKITANATDKLKTDNKKPSDFFGTLSVAEGEKFQKYITDTRIEWERDI